MKILLLNVEYPPLGGGGGVFCKQLTEAWVEQGHEVDVVTSNFHLPRFRLENGVRVYRVPVIGRKDPGKASIISMVSFPLSALLLGIRLCKKKKYDVINTHFAIPTGPIGIVLQKIFRIKNILSIHGADIYDPTRRGYNRIFRPLVQYVLNHNSAIIAQSQNTKNNAQKYYHPKKDIRIIPLGIRVPAWIRQQTDKTFPEKDSPRHNIIAIGRLVKRKGFENLVRALPHNMHLKIIGTGPEKKNLLRINPAIEILENISEEQKWQELMSANLFVLSSLHEGFSLATVEAMAAGLPIVATNVGGHMDFLKQNENAILIPPQNVLELQKAIQYISAHAELRFKMAKNNAKKSQLFNIETIANQYIQTFQIP